MLLDQKAIVSAVGALLAERDKTIAEMQVRIDAMQARVEALERAPSRTLRAVGE